MSEFGTRLKELIFSISKGKTQKEFAESIDVAPASLSEYIRGVVRNGKVISPSIEFLNKLLTINPNINLNWLLTGEGEMLYIPQSEEDKAKIERVNTLTIMYQELVADGLQKDQRIKELEEKLKNKKKGE